MTYKNLKTKFKKYKEDRGWNNQAPVDIIKSIIIEAAELLEHFQWDETSRQKGNEKRLEDKDFEKIKDEIGDIGVYLLGLCQELNVDLIEVINDKLDKVIAKYPADKIKNDKTGFYIKRKHEFRK